MNTEWDNIDDSKKNELWSFAEELSRAGSAHSLQWFGQSIEIDWKADASPVTRADRETELLMREMIEQRYPDHAIHGEEFGQQEYREFTWILDPIDGTKSFINGVPLYCNLTALLHQGKPVIGVINNPPSGEMVSGCIGMYTKDSAGKQVSVADPGDSLRVYTSDFADLMQSDIALKEDGWLQHILQQPVIARTWGDAYGYLLLASGRGDIMIDPQLAIWDIAPMYPILSQAGAVLCDFSGRPNPLPSQAVACSQKLYERLVNQGLFPA